MESKHRPSSRIWRQTMEMSTWRILATAFGALGSIWAARCLGPENLGISTMVQATLTQITLVILLNQEPALVRMYKEAPDTRAQNAIISEIVSFRLLFGVAVIILAAACVTVLKVPPRWHLAVASGLGLLLVQANPSSWLLQGQENMPASYRAMALPPLLSSVCYLALFRPGMPAGADLLVALVAGTAGCALGWLPALRGKHAVRLGSAQARAVLPKLWQGRWLAITGLVVYLYVSFEMPLIGYLHSIEELGKYRTAITLVMAVQPFTAMAPQLLYPRFIEWNKLGGQVLWSKQLRLALAASLIAAPLVLLTFAALPAVYGYMFGVAFQAAAGPCAILMTSKAVVVINGIFGWGLWAQHKDKTMLLIMTVVACVSVLLNIALIPKLGMIAAASINLVSELLILVGCFCASYYYIRRESRNHERVFET